MEQSSAGNTVTPFEVAVLVLHFLEISGHKKTAQWFRREARLVLGDTVTALPTGVKDLLELLNDYVSLRERDTRRQQLQEGNPVAQSLYSLLDFHAGLPTPQCLPPVFYTAAPHTMPSPTPPAAAAAAGNGGMNHHHLQQQQHMQQGGLASALPPMIPVQAAGLSYPAAAAAMGQGSPAAEGGQHTPGRHAHRKGAPRKRRQLEGSFDRHVAAGPGGFGLGGAGAQGGQLGQQGPHHAHRQQQQQQQQQGGEHEHVLPIVGSPGAEGGHHGVAGLEGLPGGLDLLNMPLDEEGLLSLLCDDELQNRFASGLAQHITTAINQPMADSSAGPAGALAGDAHLAMPSIDTMLDGMLAELPADPDMAQLLQQVVRVDGGGGGASLSSPPNPSALRPFSPVKPAGQLPPATGMARPSSRQWKQQAQTGRQQRGTGAAAQAQAPAAQQGNAAGQPAPCPGRQVQQPEGQGERQQQGAVPGPGGWLGKTEAAPPAAQEPAPAGEQQQQRRRLEQGQPAAERDGDPRLAGPRAQQPSGKAGQLAGPPSTGMQQAAADTLATVQPAEQQQQQEHWEIARPASQAAPSRHPQQRRRVANGEPAHAAAASGAPAAADPALSSRMPGRQPASAETKQQQQQGPQPAAGARGAGAGCSHGLGAGSAREPLQPLVAGEVAGRQAAAAAQQQHERQQQEEEEAARARLDLERKVQAAREAAELEAVEDVDALLDEMDF